MNTIGEIKFISSLKFKLVPACFWACCSEVLNWAETESAVQEAQTESFKKMDEIFGICVCDWFYECSKKINLAKMGPLECKIDRPDLKNTESEEIALVVWTHKADETRCQKIRVWSFILQIKLKWMNLAWTGIWVIMIYLSLHFQ